MKKSFYIGFITSLIIFTSWEIYLVNSLNNYHHVMIPIFTIINIGGAYITGLLTCGKIKRF